MQLGTEADISVDVIEINGRKTSLEGFLDTGAQTCIRMGVHKDNLIESGIRLSAANKGAPRVLGRTEIIALNLVERILWMVFLAVENLDESDQFLLDRDFTRNFVVTVDLNNAMFRIQNSKRKYETKPVNLIMTLECKAHVFLSRNLRLKANEAATVRLRMRDYNHLSDN